MRQSRQVRCRTGMPLTRAKQVTGMVAVTETDIELSESESIHVISHVIPSNLTPQEIPAWKEARLAEVDPELEILDAHESAVADWHTGLVRSGFEIFVDDCGEHTEKIPEDFGEQVRDLIDSTQLPQGIMDCIHNSPLEIKAPCMVVIYRGMASEVHADCDDPVAYLKDHGAHAGEVMALVRLGRPKHFLDGNPLPEAFYDYLQGLELNHVVGVVHRNGGFVDIIQADTGHNRVQAIKALSLADLDYESVDIPTDDFDAVPISKLNNPWRIQRNKAIDAETIKAMRRSTARTGNCACCGKRK